MSTVRPWPPNENRCDACGSDSYFRFRKPGGLYLFFCGHHGRRVAPALIGKGWGVEDYSAEIPS